MLTNRILGAFTFRKGVYAEVEKDKTFTQTAWIIVAIVSFLSALGSSAGNVAQSGVVPWLIGAIGTMIFSLIGFAIGAFIISWVGKAVFDAQTDFEETIRVLGLAFVWGIVGFVGILALVSPALICLLAPFTLLASLLGLIAWFVAAKEALDLDWGRTILTVILGWIAYIVMLIVAGVILGFFGLAVAGIGSIFG